MEHRPEASHVSTVVEKEETEDGDHLPVVLPPSSESNKFVTLPKPFDDDDDDGSGDESPYKSHPLE